ncbi:lysogenization regulator HflD [Rheinheimera riviphila]|uniref:High frequency lysogenization protein HflD homolog n=1 Tax=Rheinheimera riviphila TaxID=1834037 RepID=A0A437R315_9GAMM|nr:high frequency lysogenization protein HflD [Rheinheimera riviphila]RVU41135.1 lysogenization regulator HflD [Rheinheimera riviphila]
MQFSYTTQTLALAALCQAIRLVQQIARGDEASNTELELCLQSVSVQDAAEPVDIFGGKLADLANGYHVLQAQLGDNPKKDLELTRYAMAVITLERKLAKSGDSLQAVGKRIERLQQQLQHFQLLDETILASMADIYIEHVSPLGQRIQIAGQPAALKQPMVQHKIRALLLAAIRAAVLWRQAGGRKYHFILQRKRLLQEVKTVLQQLAQA